MEWEMKKKKRRQKKGTPNAEAKLLCEMCLPPESGKSTADVWDNLLWLELDMSKSSSALQTFTSSPLRRVTGDLSVIQWNFSSTTMLTLVIQYSSASETDTYRGAAEGGIPPSSDTILGIYWDTSMGQKTVLKCSQQPTLPGLQQVVVQELGAGVKGVHMHQTDLSAGVPAFLAGNITTKVFFWAGSWALIPHSRTNVTWMKMAKKLCKSSVTQQVTGMNTFVTKKGQLILHPRDLCPLLLQAKKVSVLVLLQSVL